MTIFDDIRKGQTRVLISSLRNNPQATRFSHEAADALEALLDENARLERIALAAEDEPRKSMIDLMHHIREMYPAAWAALGSSGQRSVSGFINNKAAAFRAACGEGE